jgi:chemotaxis protein CheD
MQPLNGPEIVVGVGDCKIASFPAGSLSTYALGSCIALIAYDWKNKTGGLLHVMLPDSAIDKLPVAANPFVYVDTGVPELFRRLSAAGCGKHTIRCCIVGGASMMADSAHFEIGKRNYLALKKSFWRHGIFVDREDVGGNESRSVRLDLGSGRIDLRKGGAREQVFVPAGISVIGRSA